MTIPAGTTPGTWYLIGRADADGDVSESFEINNTHFIAIQVQSDGVGPRGLPRSPR